MCLQRQQHAGEQRRRLQGLDSAHRLGGQRRRRRGPAQRCWMCADPSFLYSSCFGTLQAVQHRPQRFQDRCQMPVISCSSCWGRGLICMIHGVQDADTAHSPCGAVGLLIWHHRRAKQRIEDDDSGAVLHSAATLYHTTLAVRAMSRFILFLECWSTLRHWCRPTWCRPTAGSIRSLAAHTKDTVLLQGTGGGPASSTRNCRDGSYTQTTSKSAERRTAPSGCW